MFFCYKCKKEVDLETKITRFDICEYCGAALRCCINCKYHDSGMPNECREPTSAYIPDREAGNFCGFFQYVKGKDHLGDTETKDETKSKFDSLFKK